MAWPSVAASTFAETIIATGVPAGVPGSFQALAMDNTGPTNQPLYVGYALVGTTQASAGWAIKKLSYDGNNVVNQVQWATVTNNIPAYNLIWNSRAGYTYS